MAVSEARKKMPLVVNYSTEKSSEGPPEVMFVVSTTNKLPPIGELTKDEPQAIFIKMGRNSHVLCAFENCFLPLYIPLSIKVTEYLAMQLKHQPDNVVLQPKQRQFSVKMMLDSLQGLQVQPLKNTQLNNINTLGQWDQRCAEQLFIKAKNDNE